MRNPGLSIEEHDLLEEAQGHVLMFRLNGPLSFGSAKGITKPMGIVEHCDAPILDLSDVQRLGLTALLAIETMLKDTLAQRR